MGYYVTRTEFDQVLARLSGDWECYAPVRMPGEGMYSDTDVIRYGKVQTLDEMELEEKSDYSFKEVLLPITQRLFYYTEDQVKEAKIEREKGVLIFLRSCDLHAVKRLDEVYLKNGGEDYYYKRLRDQVKFVLIGCSHSFENCFCASMGTNHAGDYDMALNLREGGLEVDCRFPEAEAILKEQNAERKEVKPDAVEDNDLQVKIPEDLGLHTFRSEIWKDYDSRCIGCGRCNFVCPTCTCFTMQDIFYQENGKVGERRRVHASCMVDGFTDVAGGGGCRRTNGERMRFKVMHKIYDYQKRFGYQMCVGCGRCDDVCPEYISFSGCINKLGKESKI